MEQIKTIMGEAVSTASPNISPEQEAANNAAFGRYVYDPSSRMQSTVSLPGWQGYSTSYNPNGFYGGYQQQPMGYIGQAIYGNGYNNYGLGMNPYINNNPYMQFQKPTQPQQPQTIQIPGLNYRGEFLPPIDYEEKINDLVYKFWLKEQEQAVRDQTRFSNFGYGYYGNMMYNNYFNPVRSEVNEVVQNMMQEARDNRQKFNLNLAKAAYNLAYGEGNYDEEQLEELYMGRTIDNPFANCANQLMDQNRFANCVPFDNSNYYQALHSQVSNQHNAIIPPDSNIQDAFKRVGELQAIYDTEEEQHRRRNLSGAYNSDGYKYFIRKCIAERNNKTGDNRFSNSANVSPQYNGGTIPIPPNNIGVQQQTSPTIGIYTSNPRKGGKLVGTIGTSESIDSNGNINVSLSVPCNFGSQAGTNYMVNSNEAAYDKKREEFNRFLDSIPKSTYTLTPGGG